MYNTDVKGQLLAKLATFYDILRRDETMASARLGAGVQIHNINYCADRHAVRQRDRTAHQGHGEVMQPKVEVLPIAQGATPDENNVNKHTQRGGGLLENSLRKRGAFRSIASAGKGVDTPVVYAGNFTLQKAVDAGFTEVVNVHVTGNQIVNVVRDDIAPGTAEAIALGLEDNEVGRLSYNPDIDLLAQLAAADNGILAETRKQDKIFDDLVKGMGLKEEIVDAEPQTDRAAELLAKWQVERGQLWAIGEHRLLCGDSTRREDVERVMSGEKAVLMVTDPPYGVEYDANWRNEMDRANGKPYGAFAVGQVTNDDRIDWREAYELFNGDIVYVWHCDRSAKQVSQNIEDAGFVIIAQIIWVKNNIVIGRGDYHYKHEPCWYAVRKGHNHNWQGSRTEASVWEIDKPMKSETGHSTQKPIECMAKPIDNNTKTGDLVYEPFAGSGTTLVACENLGRKGRAIEISPAYCAVILERMSTAFPQLEIKRIQ